MLSRCLNRYLNTVSLWHFLFNGCYLHMLQIPPCFYACGKSKIWHSNTSFHWNNQYGRFVKPAFDDFVLPSKKYADVIIPKGGDNHVAIDLIVQHIRTKLGQHDLCKIYPNVFVVHTTFQVHLTMFLLSFTMFLDLQTLDALDDSSEQIRGMHTLIRDRNITTPDFVFYSDRLIRLVLLLVLMTSTNVFDTLSSLRVILCNLIYTNTFFCM